jgi:hypothetical protein
MVASLLIVVFVAVAVAKPWGAPAASAPSSGPPAPSSAISGTETGSPILPTSTPARPVDEAITLATPPPAGAAWTAIQWTRLAPDDPLSLLTSVTRWRGGFLAVGWDVSAGTASTPVWTSSDGATWEPLPSGTGATFWPGMLVVGVAEVPAGLVALTEPSAGTNCGGGSPCPRAYDPGVVSWTSSDGRTWTPRGVLDPGLSGLTSAAPLLAAGPAGLVVMSSGPAAQVAASSDGVAWRTLPDGTIPSNFVVADLRGTATGYVAGGRWMASESHWDAATLWSANGRAWTATPALPLRADAGITPTAAAPPAAAPATATPTAAAPAATSPTETRTSSDVVSLVLGRDGLITIGRGLVTSVTPLWWQSSDARHWRPLTGYPPLGPTMCVAQSCDPHPNGALVGDGERLVALRGGPDAGVWTSLDGLAWSRLPVTGDLPDEAARDALLLPGGVLLSDGTRTWLGVAVAR